MLVNNRYFPPPESKASCQLCQDLMIRREDEAAGSLGVPLWLLAGRARSGCFVCRVLYDSVTDLTRDFQIPAYLPGKEFIGFTIRSTKLLDSKSGKYLPSPLSLVMSTEYSHVVELEVFSPEGKPTVWPLIGPARDISLDASSEHCIASAMGWMKNCIEFHPQCRNESNPVMPDRLIYVGKDSTNPYLHINDSGLRGKYIALSHCWGGQSSLCLTDDTLSDMKKSIPSTAIPRTFSHAIEISRRLGANYIWIDSLCIIQNSTEDWLIQASKMFEYYANSWVTIAADGATNSSQGFLRDERRNMEVKRFRCPGLNGEDSEICVRRKGVGGFDYFSHHFWAGPRMSHLSTRGWTLQESLIAPRILHFTAEELTWECSVESRCECQVLPHQVNVEKPLKMALNALPFDSRWINIVHQYTNRALTYQRDKLAALSGIARYMQGETSAVYWAGLWSDTFPECLLWWVLDRYQNAKYCTSARIQEYQAPTWSWASVTGRVLMSSTGSSLLSDLEDFAVSVSPMGIDPYGPLQHASIKTRAYLASVSVSSSPRPNKDEEGYKFYILSDTAVDGEPLAGVVEPDVHGGANEIDCQQSYLVLIIGHTSDFTAHCLLVSEDKHDSNTYRRVGLIHHLDYTEWVSIAMRRDVTLI